MSASKPPLSRREREVMDVLYRMKEGTVVEMMAELAPARRATLTA